MPLSTLTHAIPRTNSQQPLTVNADILCVPVSRSHNVDRWQTILLGTQTCYSIFFGCPFPFQGYSSARAPVRARSRPIRLHLGYYGLGGATRLANQRPKRLRFVYL